jgi:hypothetical protein
LSGSIPPELTNISSLEEEELRLACNQLDTNVTDSNVLDFLNAKSPPDEEHWTNQRCDAPASEQSAATAPSEPAPPEARCFDETGFCISGPIRAYWEQHGGLAVFGYPITAQHEETVEGTTLPVQWFERDRLEDHGAAGVMAGRLGVDVLAQRGTPWESYPRVAGAADGCYFFVETGHSLCEPFLSYWQQRGGLQRFGYPITEPMQETIGDWTGTVQYFERRRMEHHAENAPPYDVLLGLLGRKMQAVSQ